MVLLHIFVIRSKSNEISSYSLIQDRHHHGSVKYRLTWLVLITWYCDKAALCLYRQLSVTSPYTKLMMLISTYLEDLAAQHHFLSATGIRRWQAVEKLNLCSSLFTIIYFAMERFDISALPKALAAAKIQVEHFTTVPNCKLLKSYKQDKRAWVNLSKIDWNTMEQCFLHVSITFESKWPILISSSSR